MAISITSTSSRTAAIAAVLIISAAYHGTSAKASALPAPAIPPAPAIRDCFRAIVNTSDCLTYVKAGSNLTEPDKGCCPEIAGLVETKPLCLCEFLGHPEATGFTIDVKRALNLSSVCGLSTAPNVTSCSAAGVPVSLAPLSQDAMSPSDLPTERLAPSPSEQSTFGYLGNEEDGASTLIKDSTLPFIFSLATAIIISILF